MFASKTLMEHLARGFIGFGAFALSAVWSKSHPVLALVGLPVALLAFRGCPMCWTVGLVQTVIAKVQGKSTEGLCPDGSCATRLASSRPNSASGQHSS